MKKQKDNLICAAVVGLVLVMFLAVAWCHTTEVRVLSDAELGSLVGGVRFCDHDLLNCKCRCETHACEDIECSKGCISGTIHWFEGNAGNTTAVSGCYQTTAIPENCTFGTWWVTSCEGDAWHTAGCVGSPDHADVTVLENDCS